MSLLNELKRRNVFRVAVAYLAAAWVLTEVSGTLFPLFGFGDTPARMVVLLLAIGFPLFVIFSWAYEITPEGLKRERDVVREESITHLTAKRLDGITIALILVALLFIVADRLWLSSRPSSISPSTAENMVDPGPASEREAIEPRLPSNSIAVLPFVNMSPDPDNEYFADGLSEELLNVLARVDGLSVAGRTSSFHFKGSNPDLREAGKILGVAHILEGSVRKQNNQVRVTAQLIHASDGFHMWSDTYDFQLDDIFAVQDQIAAEVADALRAALLGEAQGTEIKVTERATPNIDASTYSLYLQALARFGPRTLEGHEAAIKLLKQVTERAPEFAEGWAALSDITLLLHHNHRTISWANAKYIAAPAVANALALAPDESVVQAAWAHYNWDRLTYDGYQPSREILIRAFERAIELDPRNPEALYWYAAFWSNSNERKHERALALLERALAIDPLKVIARTHKVVNLHALGRIDEARAYAMESAHLFPQYTFYYVSLARIEESRGRMDLAWLWLEQADTTAPSRLFYLERLYIAKSLNYEAGIRGAAAQLSNNPYSQPVAEAFSLALDGDFASALSTIESAAEELGIESFNLHIADLKAIMDDCAGALEAHTRVHGNEIYNDAESMIDRLYVVGASTVAYCMNRTGRTDQAKVIAEAIIARTDWVDEAPLFSGEAPDFQLPRIAALCVLGDKDRALRSLEEYIAGGQRNLWRNYWVKIDQNPLFQVLHNDPLFIELVEQVRAENARMLDAVLSGKVLLEDEQ
jgi:TolB-like protein/Tfp pilus assembly protein PilF